MPIILICAPLYSHRELTFANTELYSSLSESQHQMLQMARVPSGEGKKLVRDVLMSREAELSRSRREAKALRDRIEYLEGVIAGTNAAAAEAARGQTPVLPSWASPSSSPSPSSRAPGGPRADALDLDTGTSIDYPATSERKKQQALNIVVMELQRLRKATAELEASKRHLGDVVRICGIDIMLPIGVMLLFFFFQASRQSEKATEMELAVYSLQEKITEKHRREEVIVSFIENNLPESVLEEFHRFMFDMDTGVDRATTRPIAQYPIGSRLGSTFSDNRSDLNNSTPEPRAKSFRFGKNETENNFGDYGDIEETHSSTTNDSVGHRSRKSNGETFSAKVKKKKL
jgi:hypothetical protein